MGSPLCCVIRVNYNVVKNHVGRGSVSVAPTMAKHQPPAQLGNPSPTPPTLYGPAFQGWQQVSTRKRIGYLGYARVSSFLCQFLPLRSMVEHQPPAQLGNPSRTPLTLHGQAFLGRQAVTERKGKQERRSR